jgi:hypothetical protein
MININEHIEEFNGKKYIPLEIAIKAINNIYADEALDKIDNLQAKLTESIKNISNIKLDD